MATTALSRQARQEAIAAFDTHGNITAAAIALGLPRNTYASRLARARQLVDEPIPEPIFAGPRLPQSADECWEVLDRAIGRYRETVKPPKHTRTKFSDERIAVMSDLHCPFQHVGALAMAFSDTEGFDTLVINGDLQDHYAVSRFAHKEDVSIHREMAAVDAVLAKACERFSDVVIVDGNHDRPRFEKTLRQKLTLEEIHVLEVLTEQNFSVIRLMAKRYKNIRFAPIVVGRHQIAWAAQVGDMICSHAERSSQVPSTVLRVVDQWFDNMQDALDMRPYRVIVQAHTHQLGQFPWRNDKMLVEGGCLCDVQGYALDSKIFGRGQRLGYVTLTQRDGVSDYDSVRFRWLDPRLRAAA